MIARNKVLLALISLFLWALYLGAVTLLFKSINSEYFTADSWYFVDLARHLQINFWEFGNANGTRNFIYSENTNAAFPLGWPLVIATFWFLGLTGTHWIVAISIVSPFLLVATVLLIWRKSKNVWVYSAFSGLFLTLNPYLIEDIMAGRSHSLALSSYLSALLLLANIYSEKKKSFQVLYLYLSAIFLLIASGTRIDFILYSGLLVFFFTLIYKPKIITFLLLFCSATLPLAAWASYSILNFGTFFVTETRNSLNASEVILPTDFLIDGAKFVKDFELFAGFSRGLLSFSNLGSWSLILLVGFILSISFLLRYSKSKFNNKKNNKKLLFVSLIYISSIFIVFAEVSISGYPDSRYWLPSMGIIGIGLLIFFELEMEISKSLNFSLTLLGSFLVMFMVAGAPSLNTIRTNFDALSLQEQNSIITDQRIVRCLSITDGNILITDNGVASRIATKGVKTIMWPTNAASLSQQDWEIFARKYHVVAVLDLNSQHEELISMLPKGVTEISCTRQ